MTEGAGRGDLAGPVPITRTMLTTQDRPVTDNFKMRAALMEQNRRRMERMKNPYRPLHEVLADGAWTGEPAYIIGGGPSLAGFEFGRLRGRGRVIAINRAYEFAPFADILFFMDNGFYQWVHDGTLFPGCLEAWNAFQGYRVFLNIIGREYGDVYSIRSLGRVGLSSSLKQGIYHGNNSGVGAVNLAFILKANPIYLLGIDCKIDPTTKAAHFHSGYTRRPMGGAAFKSFQTDFARLARFTSRTSFSIINLNPNSGVRNFPFSTIDEVLGDVAGPVDDGADLVPGLNP